ncbi:MAG: hypothetical protein M3153_10265 [Chloroflexota bacterium]|nr:hypothetical protein [Chloroflexota bacterium]
MSVRPDLWLPGALAWVTSVGWIPFVLAVVRPPTVAELTFLGARIVTSGAWPWNGVLIALVAVMVVLLAFVLVAAANAVLIGLVDRRSQTLHDVGRMLAVSLVAAVPAVLTGVVVLLALAAVAPGEFNAPEPGGGPILRTGARVAPFLALLLLTSVAGGALAAIGGRISVRRRAGTLRSLRAAAALTVTAPLAVHAVMAVGAQLTYLAFAAVLLGVLWAPIGPQLGQGGIQVPAGLLLVGFVAIWLCLVLAGGALHAWSAATWSRLLATDAPGRI